MATKRITIEVNQDVDEIRERLVQETGIRMSYVQIFNYLIHYYMKNTAPGKTTWRTP